MRGDRAQPQRSGGDPKTWEHREKESGEGIQREARVHRILGVLHQHILSKVWGRLSSVASGQDHDGHSLTRLQEVALDPTQNPFLGLA